MKGRASHFEGRWMKNKAAKTTAPARMRSPKVQYNFRKPRSAAPGSGGPSASSRSPSSIVGSLHNIHHFLHRVHHTGDVREGRLDQRRAEGQRRIGLVDAHHRRIQVVEGVLL